MALSCRRNISAQSHSAPTIRLYMSALSALQNLFQVKFNNLFPGQTDFSQRVTVKKSEAEEREKYRGEDQCLFWENGAETLFYGPQTCVHLEICCTYLENFNVNFSLLNDLLHSDDVILLRRYWWVTSGFSHGCPEPIEVQHFTLHWKMRPQWVKMWQKQKTARNCLGFRGLTYLICMEVNLYHNSY